MKVLVPITVTDDMLDSSTLAEDDHAAYDAGTTYAEGDRVVYAHRIFESLQGSNLNKTPGITASATWWLDTGPTNRWAMFDQVVSTVSSGTGSIVVEVTPGQIVNAVAIVQGVGDSVRVRSLDYTDMRTNLLLRSQEFDNASWTKVRASVAPNAIAAPDGTMTADKLFEDTTSSSTHLLQQSASVSAGATTTFGLYVLAGERSALFVQLDDGTSSNQVRFSFNITGDIASAVAYVGAGANGAASISSVGNGWRKIVVTGTPSGSATTHRIGIHVQNSYGTTTYTGDGTSGLYIWGAQLEAGSEATEYIPTEGTTATAPTILYDETQTLDSTPIEDWDDFFFAQQIMAGELLFEGMPRYLNATLEVTLTGPSAVSLGVLAIGTAHEIGGVEYGATAGITDYSRKEADEFGNTLLVQRGYARRTNQRLIMDTNQIKRVQAILASLRATPCVWIGDDDTDTYAPLVVYGWCRDFQIEVAYPTMSYCTIEIEGLT